MAESLPPSGHRYSTRRNTRKRSLEADEAQKDQPAEKTAGKEGEEEPSTSKPGEIDCAICLQSCVHPARLPCGHIFCFLCLKGVFRSCAKCAMCRRPIPRNYLETPDLLEIPMPASAPSGDEEEFHWFYEGRHGGWWQYEERMSRELEEQHKSGSDKFETIICGHLYTIDFANHVQFRNDCPFHARRILRQRPSLVEKRGVAGIK
uniref:E3 ubiquitin-protein ligase n=1 Tax=Lygus hesperus TaxID=30085 RepID=A0A146L5C5_LYGHE